MHERWQCRVAPSLGDGFAGTPNEVWGTVDYENDTGPTVFFGLYGLPDFYALWRHKGRKCIFWAGSDITHFKKGYWLEDGGRIRLDKKPLVEWINKYCESYVENEVEKRELLICGITATVVPSFLGNVDEYEVNFKPNNKYYTSVSGDNFKLYGWDMIDALADMHPDKQFHLYGNKSPWHTTMPNVFVHGRVTQEEMNNAVQKMHGALRLTKFDGFSEILAKSVLWAQRPVSLYIPYPHIEDTFVPHRTPNLAGREYYKEHLNKFPWNVKLSS